MTSIVFLIQCYMDIFCYLLFLFQLILWLSSMASVSTGLNLGGRVFFGGLCVGTFGLGCWQTQRFFEKQEQVKQREADLLLDPLPLLLDNDNDSLLLGVGSLRRQRVHGVYRHSHEILIGPRGPPPGAMASTGPSSGRGGGGMSSSPQVLKKRYKKNAKLHISYLYTCISIPI